MTSSLQHISAISLFVEDLRAAKAFYMDVFGVAVLRERGVVLHGPVDRPWGMRTANFVDPAGHGWEVGQRVVPK
jgi:hypothetical protein